MLQNTINLNESSNKVVHLHKALTALGYTVNERERREKRAGESTRKNVQELRKKLQVRSDDFPDESVVLDEATAKAILNELKERGLFKGDMGAFTISGKTFRPTGEQVKKQPLIAVDVDLKGAAVYRTIDSVEELRNNGGFEVLAEFSSERDGTYSFSVDTYLFKHAERKKADIVVFAIDHDAIIGRSRMVNAEDYSDKAEVRNLDVIITKKEERTEYVLLMEKLNAFLRESKVQLSELAASNDQVLFTAGELDEDVNKIRLAVDAETLRSDKREAISHELLYGLGRQEIQLTWLMLFKRKRDELEEAIAKSVKAKIIKEFSKEEIEIFLKLIHQYATSYVLSYKGKNGVVALEKTLSYALPEQKQREAFVRAVRNFKGDSKNFWNEYLPKLPEFKDNPQLKSDLLFTQQLILISGNHNALIEELQANRKYTFPQQLVEIDEEEWQKILKQTDVPDSVKGHTKEERIKAYAQRIQTTLQAAFPTQKIAVMLKKGELPIKDEKISKGISIFLTKNENFDFRTARIHEKDIETKIKEAAPQDHAQVTKELKRIQRIFQVSPTPQVMSKLMENSLDSAYTISSIPKKTFIKTYSKVLGGELIAEATYQRSAFIRTLAEERAMKVHTLTRQEGPRILQQQMDENAIEFQMQKHIPDHSELFRSPDICECENCRSVYSPSAYFVELLRFLWRGAKNGETPNGKSPLEKFAERRPDLLHLPLTCENSNTLIPYIDLANEVMEYYTFHGTLDNNAAYDTGDTTADELRAMPQNFKLEAYDVLKKAVYPFSLPYHQPLDVIRTYLDHLKIERYEVMKVLQKDTSSGAVIAIESEALKMSEEEFRVLTNKKFDGTADVDELTAGTPIRQVQQYYGYPFADPADSAAVLAVADNLEKLAGIGVSDGIHEFLRRSGLQYTDLVELTETKFINPHRELFLYLEKLFSGSGIDASGLYSRLGQISTGSQPLNLNPTSADSVDAKILAVLNGANIAPAEFVTWVQRNFDGIGDVITLFEPDSLCDLDTTNLRTNRNRFPVTNTSGITLNVWSKIHRFIRLWKKLGWTIHEVDVMLSALDENDITEVTISKLSSVARLHKELKIPLSQLATLWGPIDTYGDESLYKKLFLNKAVQRIDSAFKPNKFGDYLTDTNHKLIDHIPAILAAFKISEEDLKAILNTATVIDGGTQRLLKGLLEAPQPYSVSTDANLTITFPADLSTKFSYQSNASTGILISKGSMTDAERNRLKSLNGSAGFQNAVDALYNLTNDILNVPNLSTIFRYTVLSKALKWKVQDFCLLVQLFGKTPFSNFDIQLQTFTNISPTSAYDLYTLLDLVKKSGFKPEVLRYIFRGELPAESALGLSEDKIIQTARTIGETLNTIEHNYPADPLAPLSTEFIKNLLLHSFTTDVVNHLIGIIEASHPYSTLTVTNLTVTIPANLLSKFNYNQSTGKLTCTGIMLDAEKTALKALSTDNNFQSAVDALFVLSRILLPSSPVYDKTTATNLPVVITESLSTKYSYSRATGKLTCRGILFDAEKTALKALSTNSNFNNAIDTLSEMPKDFIRQYFSGLFANTDTTFTILLNHPVEEKLRLIYDSYLPLLKRKLHKDAITQHIAALIGLSEEVTSVLIKDDVQFISDTLVQQGFSSEYFSDATWNNSALERTESEINLSPAIWIPPGDFSVRWQAYLVPPSSGEYIFIVDVKEANNVFRLYLDGALILDNTAAPLQTSVEIAEELNASQAYHLVLEYAGTSQQAGAKLSWRTAITAVETVPSSSTFPYKAIVQFIERVTLYHRAAKFISGFGLSNKEVSHFIKFSTDFSDINFKVLQTETWQRINNYVQLRNAVPQTQSSLVDVFAAANVRDPEPAVEDLIIELYKATGWDNNTINDLINRYFIWTKDDFKNEIKISILHEAVKLASKTGMPIRLLGALANSATEFNELNTLAELTKRAVKAKYEEQDWLQIAGKLSNKIRENQKGALIHYLLTKEELIRKNIRDADGLFEYFLIDVQMGACMDTSRIVQATAAVQMFVNSCLLNLESNKSTGAETGVSPDAIDADRWEWMKNYRVWEVNRKIFLYPENWLDPEWRDDRSPFFKELESELTQNDITDKNVETTFRNYLTKLNTVANLDVCGTYQENDSYGNFKMLHVFGKTHNAPYQFFYRTWNSDRKWTAWEKVQVDIRVTGDGDNSGVHLVPVVWKSRLLLFWAEFVEKLDSPPGIADKTIEKCAEQNSASLEAEKYYEVKLAFSEYIDNKWSGKQLTTACIKLESLFTSSYYTNPIKTIILKSEITPDALYIRLYQRYSYEGEWLQHLGYFKSLDIQSNFLAFSHYYFEDLHYESAYRYESNFQKHLGAQLQLEGNIYFKRVVFHNLLFSNNRLAREGAPNNPFFFQDVSRNYFYTYFVRPVHKSLPDQTENPDRSFTGILGMFDQWFAAESTSRYDREALTFYADSGNGSSTRAEAALQPLLRERTATNEIGPGGSNRRQVENSNLTVFGEPFSINTNLVFTPDLQVFLPALEFHTFYHPFSSQFINNLNQHGIKGLMESDTTINSDGGSAFNEYDPNFGERLVKKAPPSDDFTPGAAYTYYKENVCFDVFGANSIYNWELFFHAPLYVATRLSRNGKFKEAMKWFHYIFDPTTDEPPQARKENQRYWKVLPFRTTPSEDLGKWFMRLLPNDDPAPSAEDQVIREWRNNPFKPHLIARGRPLAYMKNVVIKYVENLVAWGDSLFRMFTRESVNEALQLYVIANHILGPRPQFVPKRGEIKAETYESLNGKWDDFSNALVELENIFPYSSSVAAGSSNTTSLLGIGPALYFCIPNNEKLMEQWDTVADRLFKIRHCMDINGVERHLALFSPPIEPDMLINAASQGLSLGSILADLSTPLPIYRFNYLLQRASDFCAEVKSLGSTLLSVLEKKDSEELSRLRASHEAAVLELMTAIKDRQVLDAKASKESLMKARETAAFRLKHYFALLSNENIEIPSAPTVEPALNVESQLPVDTSIAEIKTDVDDSLVDTDLRGVKLISTEHTELALNTTGMAIQFVESNLEVLAASMHNAPTYTMNVQPTGIGLSTSFGGSNVGSAISGMAKSLGILADLSTWGANMASKMASYIRREQDWTLQANLAAKEIIQLDKQITSADIKIQIAEKELEQHRKQIENSKQVESFLKEKFTNQELYQWMKEQLFAVYKQSYNLAYDMAKKVEKCYRYETGNEITNFIQYGYWDNTQQGLCAGEKLHLALRKMEKSYLEENKRELELAKSVSIFFWNPLALQELRTTGKCFIAIPEELYDLDYQGHYFRRIKSVSLSLPCIAGPFTTVNCTLRLLRSTVRINTLMDVDGNSGNYEHNNEEGIWIDDSRFRDSNVPVKAIATSTGQQDSGMFELNFRDERYLPFEGAGAISEWKIELTQDPDLRQFDYSTISDVILHISYTAREDAGLFKEKAVVYLKKFLANAAQLSKQPLMRMFSMKHEFATEWYKFLNPAVTGSDQILAVTFRKEHFPFFAKGRGINVKKFGVLMKANRQGEYKMILTAVDSSNNQMISSEISMFEDATYANMHKATLTGITSGIEVEKTDIYSPMTLKFKHNSDGNYHSIDTGVEEEISDLFVIVHYSLG